MYAMSSEPTDVRELDARVTELESRFSEEQRLIDELSGVIFGQQRLIDELTRRLQRLDDKVAAEPGLVERSADDKPPHY
jgi:SlyX protein